MSVVLACIRSKMRGGPVRWKRKATILESICYSYVFAQNAYYFRFSNDGRLLFGVFKPDNSVVYILSWFYETKRALKPHKCIGRIQLHEQNDNSMSPENLIMTTVFDVSEYASWVSLSYSLRSSPSYVIGYCTEGSSTLHTINVMQPCNLSSPIQCDRHLMTVHASSISLLLPCAESILFLWFPQKATPIASSHTIPCFPEASFFPVICNRRTNLPFMDSSPTPLWCFPTDICVTSSSTFLITPEGVSSEEIGDAFPFTQLSIDLSLFLGACFPRQTIHSFAYRILHSYRCCNACPSPHVIVGWTAITSSGEKKRCHWLCTEIHFHSRSMEQFTEDAICDVFATVIDKRVEGVLSPGADERKVVKRLLVARVKPLLQHACWSEQGNPVDYILRVMRDQSPHIIVNTCFDDVLVSSL
ncbi:hypothetical protein WA588_000362 [Blastocystis sp. NMH]